MLRLGLSGPRLRGRHVMRVSGAGSAPRIAQGGKPSQRVTAINPVMHQEASEEGVHLRFSETDRDR
jgi:hypothetical protein